MHIGFFIGTFPYMATETSAETVVTVAQVRDTLDDIGAARWAQR